LIYRFNPALLILIKMIDNHQKYNLGR